jgi:hypothetical protein
MDIRAKGLFTAVATLTVLLPGLMYGTEVERRLPSKARQATTEVLFTLNWPGTRKVAATRW